MEDIKNNEAPARELSELEKQTHALVQGFSAMVISINKQFEKPDMMAAAAALVQMQAGLLATIPNQKVRKTIRKSMDQQLSHRLARILAAQEQGLF